VDAKLAECLMIRPYTQADWTAVCRIHDAARVQELAAGKVDAGAFRPMTLAAERDEFFDSITAVACVDDRVIGFVSWNGAYLSWLYVEPSAQRRGIGWQLLKHALEQIGPEAWTNALGENNAAISLYERAGFEIVWTRRSDCEGFPCDAMRLALPTSRMRDPQAQREPQS
jgi:ribosomal protein S18 acetylase RimI-like enzyme